MKKLLTIVFTFLACTSFAQTKLGLRANSAPWQVPYYDTLNATVSRQIIADNLLNANFNSTFNNSLLSLKQEGVETIVCLRFPTNPQDLEKADRSPYLDSVDMDTTLANVESFLLSIAGNLDYIQIQNEPTVGPGKYLDTLSGGDLIHLGYYGYKWMDTLASHLSEVIQQNNLNIGIIGPAFHDVEDPLDPTPQLNPLTYIRAPGDTVFAGTLTTDYFPKGFEGMMMDVSLDHCDLIDVHLNVDGIPAIDTRISNLNSLQLAHGANPLLDYTTLEWSQAFEKNALINSTPSYQQFLDDAYNGLVSYSEWSNFIIDSLDYDTTFIQNAYCKFQEYNLVHACYAGLIMYGNPADDFAQVFSTVALLTNSVTPTLQRNEPFFSLFQNIDLNCGLSVTNEIERGSLHIWPNPAESILTIEIPINSSKAKIEMYSLEGKSASFEIEQQILDNQTIQVDISKLKPGVYYVKISNEDSSFVDRFVKM
ncbi:MAG: T9SS type A sorting domain-containing protein [bacterium]|nr:T9SS type A sorting domain-containing protein [bacterium]